MAITQWTRTDAEVFTDRLYNMEKNGVCQEMVTTRVCETDLQCNVCMEIRDGPLIQTTCGHIICTECNELWYKECMGKNKNGIFSCPSCRTVIDKTQTRNLLLEKFIGGIPADCIHGCNTRNLTRSTISDHENKCARRKIPCRYKDVGCNRQPPHEELAAHEKKCPFRFTYSVYCKCARIESQMRAMCGDLEARIDKLEDNITNIRTQLPSRECAGSHFKTVVATDEGFASSTFVCLCPVLNCCLDHSRDDYVIVCVHLIESYKSTLVVANNFVLESAELKMSFSKNVHVNLWHDPLQVKHLFTLKTSLPWREGGQYKIRMRNIDR
jgi:hypothetical protein